MRYFLPFEGYALFSGAKKFGKQSVSSQPAEPKK